MTFPFLHSNNHAASFQKLCSELTSRCPEFRRDEIKVKLSAHPFDLAVEDSPDECQMGLIEKKADMDTKRGYYENSLVDFYKLYVCGKFPNLSHQTRKMIFLLGNTYYREQFFKKMKLIKTRCQSQLTDEHLNTQLRVATTSVNADIDELCKDSKYQVSHKNGLS